MIYEFVLNDHIVYFIIQWRKIILNKPKSII